LADFSYSNLKNTFVLLTAWSSKSETPPPKGIEAPGLIGKINIQDIDPRESFITCLMSMTPSITARRVGGTRRRVPYRWNYHI